MLVWRGWGILVVVIGFGALLLTQLAVDAVAGAGTYSRNASLWAPVALLLAALIVWFVGRRFNGSEGRVLRDVQTGDVVVLRSDHSFFWIQMQYWGIVLAVVAGLIAVFGLGSR